MYAHSREETTVGMAQGIKIAARTSPRARNCELMMSAMTIPSSSSMVTDATVNLTVFWNAMRKVSLFQRYW